jgi:hypothetical protein
MSASSSRSVRVENYDDLQKDREARAKEINSAGKTKKEK